MFLFFWLFDIGRFNFYALLISLLFPVLCRSYVSIWSIIFCTQRSIRGRGVNFSPPRINHATGQSRQLSRVVPKAWARFLKGNSEFVFPFFPSLPTWQILIYLPQHDRGKFAWMAFIPPARLSPTIFTPSTELYRKVSIGEVNVPQFSTFATERKYYLSLSGKEITGCLGKLLILPSGCEIAPPPPPPSSP